MIWIDSSFAVEWLLGSERVRSFQLPSEPMGILSAQYTEIFVFFGKRVTDFTVLIEQLKVMQLKAASPQELQDAAQLYLKSKKTNSKPSLADTILATVARSRRELLLTLDLDFYDLGFTTEDEILWGHEQLIATPVSKTDLR